MSFVSLYFILFAALTVIVYFLVRKHQWVALLVFSVAYYLTWGYEKVPFILISAGISWIAGILIGRRYSEGDRLCKNAGKEEQLAIKKENKRFAKWIAVCSVILLLAMLFYVKIGKLVAEALSIHDSVSIIVPLGISYYTFSLVGYVLDCYWRKETYEKNYFKLLLFALYFPKVVQGPILKYRNLAPQLLKEHRFEYRNMCYGLQLMLWGYFKKMVIADRLALFVNTVYGDYQNKSGSMLIVATIFGALQLYCDFSGCMDIACGFSEIIGIKMERNFDHPFFSGSASEFWRRWHITLGDWFKDYVYIPVTVAPWMKKLMLYCKQKRGVVFAKKVVTIIALWIVWILTGLWHGTGLNYLVWGVYWALITSSSIVFEAFYEELAHRFSINTSSTEWRIFRSIRTFLIFSFGRILTIPGELAVSVAIIKRMLTRFYPWELFDGTIFSMGLNVPNFIAAVLFLAILYLAERYEENSGSGRDWIAGRHTVTRWIIYYGLIITISLFGIYGPGYDAGSFVYMKF